jgi:hypothetical protein
MPSRNTALPSSTRKLRLSERRTRDRFPCLRETPYRLGDEFGTAILLDLSTTGAGLLLPRQVVPGMLVSVELLDELRACWRLKLLQVVHVTPSSPDSWLVGSLFTRQLSAEELQRLLRQETEEP